MVASVSPSPFVSPLKPVSSQHHLGLVPASSRALIIRLGPSTATAIVEPPSAMQAAQAPLGRATSVSVRAPELPRQPPTSGQPDGPQVILAPRCQIRQLPSPRSLSARILDRPISSLQSHLWKLPLGPFQSASALDTRSLTPTPSMALGVQLLPSSSGHACVLHGRACGLGPNSPHHFPSPSLCRIPEREPSSPPFPKGAIGTRSSYVGDKHELSILPVSAQRVVQAGWRWRRTTRAQPRRLLFSCSWLHVPEHQASPFLSPFPSLSAASQDEPPSSTRSPSPSRPLSSPFLSLPQRASPLSEGSGCEDRERARGGRRLREGSS